MEARPNLGAQMIDDPDGIGVAQQEHYLTEYKAGGPDGRRASKPWQNDFGNNGLDLKQQESADEDCGLIDCAQTPSGRAICSNAFGMVSHGRRLIVKRG